MAAGKSTVAQKLAEKLTKSVHLRGDLFRRMIVNGREDMSAQLSSAALEQLMLRYKIAAITAEQYLAEGYSVVYQDVILGNLLNEVIKLYRHRQLHVVVLCPSAEVVAEREFKRDKRSYSNTSVTHLDHGLRNETPRLGLWLDTSELSVDETVDQIIVEFEKAEVQAV